MMYVPFRMKNKFAIIRENMKAKEAEHDLKLEKKKNGSCCSSDEKSSEEQQLLFCDQFFDNAMIDKIYENYINKSFFK